jgi:hypothetical protein
MLVLAATTDQQLLDATRLSAYASIAVALATLLLAGFTAWLAVSARSATKDTKKALDVAIRQADTARASLRASLKPRLTMSAQPRVVEAVGDTVTFEAGVHNVGRGVAVLGDVRLVFYGGDRTFGATGAWVAPQGDGRARAKLYSGGQSDELFKAANEPIGPTGLRLFQVHYTDMLGDQHQLLEMDCTGEVIESTFEDAPE